MHGIRLHTAHILADCNMVYMVKVTVMSTATERGKQRSMGQFTGLCTVAEWLHLSANYPA